jgi:DNA-binding SARP family transcriptional activator
VRILLLGPTELLSADAAPLHIGGSRRRAVLAALAVRLNDLVTVDQLADIVWDGEPPPQARAALQGHVAALRRLLPGDLVLETRGSAYRLAGEPDLVDCHRFDTLVTRASTAGDAAHLLEQALDLWRGEALADLTASAFFRARAERLDEARLHAIEAWAGLEVRQGTGARMTPLLRAAVQEHPLRESLVSALMLCLHQEDRQSEAIETYHRTRQRLADDLDVRPGPDLQAAFAQVLRDPPETPAPVRHVPHQLPRRPRVFVGRAEQSAWLDRVCAAANESPLAVVTGPAGVGKTSLVLHWAHTAGERFPDGQLFADLHGFDELGPEDPTLVLARFLMALGVPEDEIPRPADERAALFRALTRDRRMLVVLDNAPDADAVRRLLPYGPGCATLVTGRAAMLDLTAHEAGALQVLGPFSSGEAVTLLEECVGAERVRREPGTAARLAGLCDNLPLALRICAARLAVRPAWRLADLVDELTDERTRLDEIDQGRDGGLTAALNLTRRHLPEAARRLVPLLGVYPGKVIDAHPAAALLGSSLPEAREVLGGLAAWHLVSESRPGRFTRQDLVVLYCRRLAAEELTTEESAGALRRLLEYYLEATAQAALRLPVHRRLISHPSRRPSGGAPRPADGPAALAWFRRVEPVVRALILDGPPEEAWLLSENAHGLYYHAPSLSRWPEVAAAAYEAARATGDPEALLRATGSLGTALAESGRPREAVTHLARAVALAERHGDRFLWVSARIRLGLGLLKLGTAARQAHDVFARTLPVAEEAGEADVLTSLHHHAGRALRDAADLPGALAEIDTALKLADGLTEDHRAVPLLTRAQILWALHRAEEAAASARAALRLLIGYRRPGTEADCRELLATVLAELGETEEARAQADRAAGLRVLAAVRE